VGTLSQKLLEIGKTRDEEMARNLQKFVPFIDAKYNQQVKDRVKQEEIDQSVNMGVNTLKTYNINKTPEEIRAMGKTPQEIDHAVNSLLLSSKTTADWTPGFTPSPEANLFQQDVAATEFKSSKEKKQKATEDFDTRLGKLSPDALAEYNKALTDPKNAGIDKSNILSGVEQQYNMQTYVEKKQTPGVYRNSGGGENATDTNEKTFVKTIIPKTRSGFMYYRNADGAPLKMAVTYKNGEWVYKDHPDMKIDLQSDLWISQEDDTLKDALGKIKKNIKSGTLPQNSIPKTITPPKAEQPKKKGKYIWDAKQHKQVWVNE
jgi:hypothetical protein